jgi:hypothetical protein
VSWASAGAGEHEAPTSGAGGSARRRCCGGGRGDGAVKFGQSSLEVNLQGTVAVFPFLQVDCFSGCPANMVLEEDFAGNGCG